MKNRGTARRRPPETEGDNARHKRSGGSTGGCLRQGVGNETTYRGELPPDATPYGPRQMSQKLLAQTCI